MLCEDDVHHVLAAALDHEKFSIEKYHIISEVDALSFHSDTSLLEIEATVRDEPARKFSFFMKSVDHDSIWYRRYLAQTRIFEKEHDMVTKLIPELETVASGKITAKCYFSKPKQFIVFENLSEHGFQPRGLLLDLDHAKIAIEALANLHAASIVWEETEGKSLWDKYKEDLYETLLAFREDLDESLMMSAHNRLRAISRRLFVDVEDKVQDEVFNKMKRAITELVRPSKKFRNVITQGDPWGGNILFRYEMIKPIEAILVDFQTVRFVPPAQEIALFLQVALPEELEIHHETLKKLYYERLDSILNLRNIDLSQIISKKEFADSYEVYHEFAVSTRAYYAINTRIPAEQLRLVTQDPEVFYDYLIGGCSKMTFEAYENHPEYKRDVDDALMKAFKYFNDL